MVTQVSARNACFLDGIAVAAQDLRDGSNVFLTSAGQAGTSGMACTAGVRATAGAALASIWTSGMSFNLNAGMCFVQGTASAVAGLWPLVLDTTATLTCTTSDPTNPRIDSVIAVVVDNGNNTSTAVFKILAGTPAGSPVAPTLPANSLLLCNIAVGANVAALTSGNFTDKRVYTTALGGILPFQNAAIGTTVGGPVSSYAHDINSGRLRTLDSSGKARQSLVSAFAPVSTNSPGPTSVGTGSLTNILSVSVTVDGLTELEVVMNCQTLFMVSPVLGNRVQHGVLIDSGSLGTYTSWVQYVNSTNSNNGGGGTWVTYVTPSAGTHNIIWAAASLDSGTFDFSNPVLRVSPSLA